MADIPQTRYAAIGDADVAYQVDGKGPLDILLFNGLGYHLELAWQIPDTRDFYERLKSVARVIIFDRRGTGMSEGVARGAIPTWEDLAEDAGTVLDAVGSSQSVIVASAETGPMAILFAATHPDRVAALILVSSYARYAVGADYPIGVAPEAIDAIIEMVRAMWGTPDLVRIAMPEKANDVEFTERAAAMGRSSATPNSAASQYNYLLRSLDARPALPLIQAPTLVINGRDSVLFPAELGHYVADHVRMAKFVELPVAGMGFNIDPVTMAGEIAESDPLRWLAYAQSISSASPERSRSCSSRCSLAVLLQLARVSRRRPPVMSPTGSARCA